MATRESETCSVRRFMTTVVGKGGCVSSSRRKPGGHGLCDIGEASNRGSLGGGGSISGAIAIKRLLFATVPWRRHDGGVVGRVNGRIWLGLTHRPEPYPSHLRV